MGCKTSGSFKNPSKHFSVFSIINAYVCHSISILNVKFHQKKKGRKIKRKIEVKPLKLIYSIHLFQLDFLHHFHYPLLINYGNTLVIKVELFFFFTLSHSFSFTLSLFSRTTNLT